MTVKLIAALVAARKQIGAAKKGATNPHFKSKYADLASVIEAVKEPLEAHGLTFVQDICDQGVVTVLFHESGESLRLAPFPIVATKQDAQGFGSALTYARRYSLQTALGVPSEDDDGNAASKVIISPVKESLKGTDVDQTKVNQVASSLIDYHAAMEAGVDTAYNAYETVETLEDDEKIAVWLALQGHSKVRSWLKKVGEERRKVQA